MRRRQPRVVRPKNQSHFARRGWQWRGGRATGYYRTTRGSWRGEIQRGRAGVRRYYIFDPPERVLDGPHGHCFFPDDEDDRFYVHFAQQPRDIDSGIMLVEAVLAGRK